MNHAEKPVRVRTTVRTLLEIFDEVEHLLAPWFLVIVYLITVGGLVALWVRTS